MKAILNQGGYFHFDFAIIFWVGALFGAIISIAVWEAIWWIIWHVSIIFK